MTQSPAVTTVERVRRPFQRILLFAAVWFVVAEADASSWLFGVPFVAVATVASLKLTPARKWRIDPVGALRYGVFFVQQSVAGGLDVSLRAIGPSIRIDPELVRYRFRIEPEHARVLIADTASLLPGTLSSGIEGDTLTMHVLDFTLPIEESTRQVEERVAGLFGLPLSEEGGTLEVCGLATVEECL